MVRHEGRATARGGCSALLLRSLSMGKFIGVAIAAPKPFIQRWELELTRARAAQCLQLHRAPAGLGLQSVQMWHLALLLALDG